MMSRKRFRRRGGFTLFEVLLVIGILALLAAFVVPEFIGAGRTAKIGISEAAVKPRGDISSALDRYKWDVGVYPDSDEGLKSLFERPSSVDEETGKWKGQYLKGSPDDLKDPWGHPYQYRFPGQAKEDDFDLWSYGPDMKDGTDDDIVNWKRK